MLTHARSATVADLIAAHRRAYAALDAASDAVDASHDRARDTEDELRVPFAYRPDGTMAGYCIFDIVGDEGCARNIKEYHEKKRRLLVEPWLKRLAPAVLDDLAFAIDASEARCMLALEDARIRYTARLNRCGIPQADKAFSEACDAEIVAKLDLILFRPLTADEAKAKADYIASAEGFADGQMGEDGGDLARLLIDRFAAPAPYWQAECPAANDCSTGHSSK